MTLTKVTQNVVQYPPSFMTYAPAKFEVATSNSLEKMHLKERTSYKLDLGIKVTQNAAQYPPHHVTFAPAKFEVALSNGLGEDAITRKYIIWPWPWHQGHMKCCLVPSSSSDLCTCETWSCYFQKFLRRSVYKKIHYLTFDIDLGVKVTQNVT